MDDKCKCDNHAKPPLCLAGEAERERRVQALSSAKPKATLSSLGGGGSKKNKLTIKVWAALCWSEALAEWKVSSSSKWHLSSALVWRREAGGKLLLEDIQQLQ